MLKVIILIPCYNEEKNIDSVIQNIIDYVLSSSLSDEKYIIDYLIINDCSKDKTLKVCKEKGYKYLNLPVNLGIGGCMQVGYLYALERGYDIAIQHDGDGQHNPSYFENFIGLVESGQADIVIGSRFLENKGFQSTRIRRFGILFLSSLIFLCTGVRVHDVTSGYRAVSRKYIELFAVRYAQDYPEPESIMDAVLNKAKVIEVPVIMHERIRGESSISALKSLYYMIKVSLSIVLYRIIMQERQR